MNTLKCSIGKERMKKIKGENAKTSKLTNTKNMVDTKSIVDLDPR